MDDALIMLVSCSHLKGVPWLFLLVHEGSRLTQDVLYAKAVTRSFLRLPWVLACTGPDRQKYTVVARCEVHGTAAKAGMKTKGAEHQYMTAFALNEWDSKLAGEVEWRQKIDTQVSVQNILLPISLCP